MDSISVLSEAEALCLSDIFPQLLAAEKNSKCKQLAHEENENQCGSQVNLEKIYHSNQMQAYVQYARKTSTRTVCETGFYLGQSAALWLCLNRNATLYSFDLEFPSESLQVIKAAFGERFIPIEGDSQTTLAEFAAQPEAPSCDIMSMDGGHYDPVPRSDLMNFAAIAARSLEI